MSILLDRTGLDQTGQLYGHLLSKYAGATNSTRPYLVSTGTDTGTGSIGTCTDTSTDTCTGIAIGPVALALALVLVLALVMVPLMLLALPGQVLILVHALEVIPLLVLVLGMALVLGCWYCWYLVLVPALTMVLVMVVAGGV